MVEFDRYGTVISDPDDRVIGFAEKKFTQEGNINGGVYIVNVSNFRTEKFPAKFSFETDYLQAMFGDVDFFLLWTIFHYIEFLRYQRAQVSTQPLLDLNRFDIQDRFMT